MMHISYFAIERLQADALSTGKIGTNQRNTGRIDGLVPCQTRTRGGGSSGVEVTDWNCVSAGSSFTAGNFIFVTATTEAGTYPQQARTHLAHSLLTCLCSSK